MILLPVVTPMSNSDATVYQAVPLILLVIYEYRGCILNEYSLDMNTMERYSNYVYHILSVVCFFPQDNQKVYVFHLVGGSLPFHLKASLLEGHRRGAEI